MSRSAGRVRVCPALALSVVLVACGGAGEKLKVEDTVHALYDAYAARDARAACRLLTDKGRSEVARQRGNRGGGSCERALSRALHASDGRIAEAKDVRVTEVTLHGDSAEAVVSLRGWKARLALAKQGGEWRVDRFRPS